MPESIPLTEAELTLLKRLERVPFGRFQWRLWWMGGLGYTFDAMDGALMAFLLPWVMVLWGLSAGETGLLGSSAMIGYLFGALFAGALGDLIGRRVVMMYALGIYCVATLIAAFSPNWVFMFGCRVIASVGNGAESAIIAPFLAEFVQRQHRGRFIGTLAGFFSYGFVFAAVLGVLVVNMLPEGWRIGQILCAAPIVMLLWWRRSLPESPRWLIERGRTAEAEAIVVRIEAEALFRDPAALPSLDTIDVPAAGPRRRGSFGANLAALLDPPVRRTTAMLWILWLAITFSYYGFFTWIPTLLVQQGMPVARSFGYSLIIYLAQIPGYYSAAFLSEKLDRKWTIVLYMILGGGAAHLLSTSTSDMSITIAGFLLSFFMNGTYAGIYAYTPELYPTAFRTTGMGVASAIGRLGGVSAPIVIGYSFNHIGFGGVFLITTVVLLSGALAVAILGIRTAGKSLEQIAAEALGRAHLPRASAPVAPRPPEPPAAPPG